MEGSYNAFGDYLLLKERSEDGLGSLWRAGEMERTGFKRIAWLRRFDQVGLDRAALTAEMPLIRQLAQAFKSTNVVRNTVGGSEDGVPFLAWDYVPAQPLDRLLTRVAEEQFPVAIDNALLIVEKMAAALSAALSVEVQGSPLVHGFLVPQLVLVGNDGEAMVAGFGLAKGLLANLDRVAVQKMAAPYLAPEVLATSSASRRADVYSLGSILYQLLCGAPLPADPAERAAVLERPQLAGEEGPVPDDVLGVLRRALAHRPEDRYSSVADFRRDLEKLLYGGAYSPTTFNLALFMDRLYRQEIEEEDRELQRERGLDVAAYYKPPRGSSDEAAAAPAPRGSHTPLYLAVAAVVVLAGVVGYLLLGRSAPKQPDVTQLIQSEVARQLAAKEQQLRAELDREKQQTAQLRAQLSAAQSTGGGKTPSKEARRRTEELEQQIAAREAEQRRKEEELRKVQQQRTETAPEKQAAVVPTAVPTAAPAHPQPTTVPTPVAKSPVPAAQATLKPTPVPPQPTVEPAQEAAPAMAPIGLGTGVREGELVDATQVDVQPQVLLTERPSFTRVAVSSKARGVVILSVLVNAKGTVEDAKILRGFPVAGLGVDEACLRAARGYRFRPATKSGVNVKTWTTITFSLDFVRVR